MHAPTHADTTWALTKRFETKQRHHSRADLVNCGTVEANISCNGLSGVLRDQSKLHGRPGKDRRSPWALEADLSGRILMEESAFLKVRLC